MRAKTGGPKILSGWHYWMISLMGIFGPHGVLAEDSVNAVVQRMKSDSAVRIAYQETRYLELFEKPVESSGRFYGMPPDSLIKEQLKPSREVMGVLKDHYYFFNPENRRHHSKSRDPSDPMNLSISAFQALANGDPALLNTLYEISFFSEPGHWYMILSDRNESQPLVRITVSGPAEEPADRIEIHELDGDRSVYRLEKDGEGQEIRAAVLELEKELTEQ